MPPVRRDCGSFAATSYRRISGLTARSKRRGAEHGSFVHIYRNECFANVALSARVMEAVRGWLPVRGDGDYCYDWEKRYLIPAEENRVCLQTHRTCQLDDDTL